MCVLSIKVPIQKKSGNLPYFQTLSLSLVGNRQERMVAIKLRFKRTGRWCFVCSSLFLTAKLKRVSDWYLRRRATLIDPLRKWWYKRLVGIASFHNLTFMNLLLFKLNLAVPMIMWSRFFLWSPVTLVCFQNIGNSSNSSKLRLESMSALCYIAFSTLS